MTWAFVYLAALLVGLVLADVTGVIRDLRSLSSRDLVVRHSDQQPAFLALLGRRLACGGVVFGLVGLVLGGRHASEPRATLAVAAGAAVAVALLSVVALRRPCATVPSPGMAVVVREMRPGGYGQVRLDRHGGAIVMAAQSIDSEFIPVGAAVEVVDCTRSVITVRRLT